MKKFLLFFVLIFSFVFLINNAGAEWTIDWISEYIWTWDFEFITYCTNSPMTVWWHPNWFLLNMDLPNNSSWMDILCWPNTTTSAGNPVTDLANDTWNGGIEESWNIMDWPIGDLIYFLLWITIITIVVLAIKSIFFPLWNNSKKSSLKNWKELFNKYKSMKNEKKQAYFLWKYNKQIYWYAKKHWKLTKDWYIK